MDLKYVFTKLLLISILITMIFANVSNSASIIYQTNMFAGPTNNEINLNSNKDIENITTDLIVASYSSIATDSNIASASNIATTSFVSTKSQIYVHDGIMYVKGESKGSFSLSGFCACKKCGTGTGLTASGKPVRENHTIAADWKVLPKGTVIILENATGKDGQVYDGVYVVEDRGGGVKNNHIDIYRPTHELASLVTHYGRLYGDVYIANEVKISTDSDVN